MLRSPSLAAPRSPAILTSPVALLLLAATAACVPAPTPPPAPAPPVRVPAPTATPLAADWQDWPVTSGTWRYDRDPRGTRAAFGVAGSGEQASIRCDVARRTISLSRAVSLAGARSLTIRTTSTTRTLPAQAEAGHLAASLPARDPLLDAVAFSRGRFTLESAGAPPLVLPPWAEVSRVIEDCRG